MTDVLRDVRNAWDIDPACRLGNIITGSKDDMIAAVSLAAIQIRTGREAGYLDASACSETLAETSRADYHRLAAIAADARGVEGKARAAYLEEFGERARALHQDS
jgi:hypothetical protein